MEKEIYYRGTSDIQLKKELNEKGLFPYNNKIWLTADEGDARYYARFNADSSPREGNPVVIKINISRDKLKVSGMSGKDAYILKDEKNNFIPLDDILFIEHLDKYKLNF